jgi:hypothetical protein
VTIVSAPPTAPTSAPASASTAAATLRIEPCPTFRHDRFDDSAHCAACGWTIDEHELYVELSWGAALADEPVLLPQALRRPRGLLTAGV